MANKSNIVVVIDNGKGGSLEISDDASGFLVVTASNGGQSAQVSLTQADSNVLARVIGLSNALRASIPQS